MFTSLVARLSLLSALVALSGCTGSYLTSPVKAPHVGLSEAGLANRYELAARTSTGPGAPSIDAPIARVSLHEGADKQITVLAEAVDPESRKRAEREGKPVLITRKMSILKIDGKFFVEALDEDNHLSRPAYTLTLLQKLDDIGTLKLALFGINTRGTRDPLVSEIRAGIGVYPLLDNSQLTASETLAKLMPVEVSERLIYVLRPKY